MRATNQPAARTATFAIILFAACALVAAQQPESPRQAPGMPSWLVNYPGVTPGVQEDRGIVETT
jgi:hypothetical protein